VKTGSTWQHRISKDDFARVIQAIKDIAAHSSAPKIAYGLDDIAKTARVAKRYVYDVYTCLFDLDMVERQHRNVFYITKKQGEALDVEIIWIQIQQRTGSQP
jgi:hypothetical protein